MSVDGVDKCTARMRGSQRNLHNVHTSPAEIFLQRAELECVAVNRRSDIYLGNVRPVAYDAYLAVYDNW